MRANKSKKLKSVTPGELLWEEFMVPMGITRYKLAKDINVPAQRVGDIILGKRAITTDTALRLSRYFGLSDEYWIKAQFESASLSEAVRAELARVQEATLRLAMGEGGALCFSGPSGIGKSRLLERVRTLRLHRLLQLRDVPSAVADRAFVKRLYGPHPYGHTPLGSESSLRALTLDDVVTTIVGAIQRR